MAVRMEEMSAGVETGGGQIRETRSGTEQVNLSAEHVRIQGSKPTRQRQREVQRRVS